MKRLTTTGIAVSVLWIVCFCALLYLKRDTLNTLKVNEWGDFFAGAVAPLAFLWLVLGYAQQGEELRLSNAALLSQQEELRKQVAETATLARNSERQAVASEQLALATKSEAERIASKDIADAQPLLRPSGGSGNGSTYTVNATNAGGTVFEVSVSCSDVDSIEINPKLQIESGQTATLKLDGVSGYPFVFVFSYRDRFNVSRSQAYQVVEPFVFVPDRRT